MAIVGLAVPAAAILYADHRPERPATEAILVCLWEAGYKTSNWHDDDLPPGAEPNGLLAGLDVAEGPNASDVIQVENHAGAFVALINRPEHGAIELHYRAHAPRAHGRTVLAACLG